MAGRSKQFSADFVLQSLAYLSLASKDDRRWHALIDPQRSTEEASRTLLKISGLDAELQAQSLRNWVSLYLPQKSWNKMLTALRQRRFAIEADHKLVPISAVYQQRLRDYALKHNKTQTEVLEGLIQSLSLD